MSFTVAIVGRPNVGKSTLFNRMIGKKDAIVDDFSGVTRDRKYGMSYWNDRDFNVIDTGGFVTHSDDVFEKEIRSQVQIAIEEASLIIFLVDCTTGITDLDEDVARILRPSTKPVLLAVNKVDNGKRKLDAMEFYSLGFEHTYFIASISGSGTGELMDVVAGFVPEDDVTTDKEAGIPKFAIIGQPNVGKSSLVNALVGAPRNIVTNIAGTTRDTLNTHYKKYGKEFILVDTAGIRKKSKVHEDLEFYSVLRAINAIDHAHVCILLIDATKGIVSQDLNIFRLAVKKNKGVVILINKWDLIEKETNTARDYKAGLLEKLAPFTDLPVIFISALEKQRIAKAMDEAITVYERRSNRISTSELNEFLLEVIEKQPPPSIKGKYIKIKYITQLPTPYPSFVFFCNLPRYIKEPYRNFLENKLRARYEFTGVPMNIYFRQK